MKKHIVFCCFLFLSQAIIAQQIPLSENYFADKYSLAPSYAGSYNPKYLFVGYRSDWTGIDGGPKTFRLAFSDILPVMPNAGYGAKIIVDKAGIFSQLYFLASYSYNLKVSSDHHILFGLSAGLYRNRINLLDYYNDPNYTIDPSLISEDINSKIKFMSDFSIVWIWKELDAGFLFSNINFGDASYEGVNLKYNPLANFQFHSSYLFTLNDEWQMAPLVILRGGRYIKSQFEISAQAIYLERFRGSIVFRDPGIFGLGLGANITKGLILGYNFNMAFNVAMGAFNNHEVSLGINIFEYINKSN